MQTGNRESAKLRYVDWCKPARCRNLRYVNLLPRLPPVLVRRARFVGFTFVPVSRDSPKEKQVLAARGRRWTMENRGG